MAIALALVAGCSDDGPSRAEPTVPRLTTTTDPFAVPDPIDVAYVERVMAELDRIYGDAAREVARERALTPRFEELMRSIYGDDETFDLVLRGWAEEATAGFTGLADEPGDPATSVRVLQLGRTDCVIADVTRDFSPMLKNPRPPREPHFVVLVRDESRTAVNSTGWRIELDGFDSDGPITEGSCSEG